MRASIGDGGDSRKPYLQGRGAELLDAVFYPYLHKHYITEIENREENK